MERLVVRLPYMIVALSERIKSDLIQIGAKADAIVSVPNGVDFDRIQDIASVGKVYDVIYAGRLVEHKHVDMLIRAISLTRKEMPGVRCCIIGDGPEKDKLGKLVDELNLWENVEFLGFLESGDDVISHFKASRIFVLPSTREGFPNTILEANACGLPAIIINDKNNASTAVVSDGVNGFIVAFSEEAIAEKINLLLRDRKSLEELSVRSRENARLYDWKVIISRLEAIYGELAGKDKAQKA